MVKREYDIFKYQNNSISLMISFLIPIIKPYVNFLMQKPINPITLEPATAEEIQTAEWYNRIHPITETLRWGAALYSAYVGYNQY